MGYTHYYYVSAEFDSDLFVKVANDFKKMITPLKHLGVVLADRTGENYPEITPSEITFNGLAKCGHTKRDLGVTWPSNTASGISKNGTDTILQDITKSSWFAGATLETRVCGGDCSHETFSLVQKLETTMTRYDGSAFEIKPQGEFREYTNADGVREKNPEEEVGKYFKFTKTAYKPYDLAVTVCLVIAKHHLKDAILVHSDGTMENWHEAMHLCHHFLGYGKGFCLDDGESSPLDENAADAIVAKYTKSKNDLESLQKEHRIFEAGCIEDIKKINDRYDGTICDLQRQQRIETQKIQEIIDQSNQDTKTKTDKLYQDIQKAQKTVYYLKRKDSKPDAAYADTTRSRNGMYLENVSEYSDSCISLHMYIAENRRPANKYSLVIVGNCILGRSNYDEAVLKIPYTYGCSELDCEGNNLCAVPKYFKSVQDAKKYCQKNDIKKILKEFFVQYEIAKSEYTEACQRYCLDDLQI